MDNSEAGGRGLALGAVPTLRPVLQKQRTTPLWLEGAMSKDEALGLKIGDIIRSIRFGTRLKVVEVRNGGVVAVLEVDGCRRHFSTWQRLMNLFEKV